MHICYQKQQAHISLSGNTEITNRQAAIKWTKGRETCNKMISCPVFYIIEYFLEREEEENETVPETLLAIGSNGRMQVGSQGKA